LIRPKMADAENSKKGQLAVRVVECASLQKADNDSSKIDPYVQVSFLNGDNLQKHKTSSKSHTNDPFFDETLYFNFDKVNPDAESSITCQVYSRNWRSKNDCLGSCAVVLSRLPDFGETIQDWFVLEKGDTGVRTGRILLCVTRVKSKGPVSLKVDKLQKHRNLNVFVTSFNCGNAAPPENLDQWFPVNGEADGHKVDVIVAGYQECEWGGNCEGIWMEKFEKAFGETYVEVEHLSMQEIRIFVYIRKELREFVSRVCKDKEATGIGHVYGNKGGVAVSFEYRGTSFCFVNAHLAAHQDKKERRDEDYSEIVENIRLGLKKQEILTDFHYVVWMGDLNYRVDFGNQTEKTPSEDVFNVMTQLIEEKRYQVLFGYDQLQNSIRGKASFLNFQEPDVTFQPTFKVERNEPFTYKMQRSPAWCDRVLWHTTVEHNVESLFYKCYPEIVTSDHKPVAALLSMPAWYQAPGTSNKPSRAVFTFRNVSAVNLIASDMMTGYSDPYIHFPRQPLLDTFHDSDWVGKTVNPQFKDKQIPNLTFLRSNTEYLDKALLRFQVRDYDRFNTDDTIGFGYLPIRLFMGAHEGNWVPFECEIVLTGKPAGILKGEAQLRITPL